MDTGSPGSTQDERPALVIRPEPEAGLRRLADLCHRLAYSVLFRAAKLAWGLTRPRHAGALVAVTVGSSMLFLRQSYRAELSMPGGGIKPGEDAAVAATRELEEELGLTVDPGALRPVLTETGLWDGRVDTVSFFEIRFERLPPLRLDNREVVEAVLAPADTLDPRHVTPAVGAYLAWRRERPALS